MMPHYKLNLALDEDQMKSLRARAIRFAREECPAGACPIESELVRCVDEFVTGLSQTQTISTYIPILAMNHVRACIDAGTCNLKEVPA